MKNIYAIKYQTTNNNSKYFWGTMEEITDFIKQLLKDKENVNSVLNWLYYDFLERDKEQQINYYTAYRNGYFTWVEICNISFCDFFSVQLENKYGNDTYTEITFKTFEQALDYINKNHSLLCAAIQPQLFGKEYINYFD